MDPLLFIATLLLIIFIFGTYLIMSKSNESAGLLMHIMVWIAVLSIDVYRVITGIDIPWYHWIMDFAFVIFLYLDINRYRELKKNE